MNSPVPVDHYTDVLCVWAWIAQRRVDELEAQWSDQIVINHHCVNVFGDTQTRIGENWADRGGYAGFAEHVEESVAPYETAPVNPDVWRKVRPYSSASAHMILKAVEIAASPQDARKFADTLRRKFFVDAVDISNVEILLELAGEAGYDSGELRLLVNSGRAHGALSADYELARKNSIKGSPTWLLNNGRQLLYGNLGYRVLNANIEELINHPKHEASWC